MCFKMRKVTTIIPAFNEEKTIANVLKTVIESQITKEIIVVNDGSTDSTGTICENFEVHLIHLPENKGKTNALSVGLKNSTHEVILFLDADLLGLNTEHITSLVQPVLNQEVKMTVGKFRSGAFWTSLSQHITPFLSGQRAIEKTAIMGFQDFEKLGFGFETALTLYFKRNKLAYKQVLVENLTHLVKEQKFGFLKGFLFRMKMYADILKCFTIKKA